MDICCPLWLSGDSDAKLSLDFRSVAVLKNKGLKNKPQVTSRSQLSVCLCQYCYNLIIFILLFLRDLPKLSDLSQSDAGWLVMMTKINYIGLELKI